LYAQSVVELNSNANQAIRKCLRVCDMIDSEMNNYERCEYTSQVSELVSILRNQNLVLYSKAVDFATDALNSRPIRDANENELIDSSRLIYDCVRDLRNALLLIPQQDGDNEFELDDEYWSPLNVNKG
jgi:catenin alpha